MNLRLSFFIEREAFYFIGQKNSSKNRISFSIEEEFKGSVLAIGQKFWEAMGHFSRWPFLL